MFAELYTLWMALDQVPTARHFGKHLPSLFATSKDKTLAPDGFIKCSTNHRVLGGIIAKRRLQRTHAPQTKLWL